MQRAMLTKIANELRDRYEPAEGMASEKIALLKQLDVSSNVRSTADSYSVHERLCANAAMSKVFVIPGTEAINADWK